MLNFLKTIYSSFLKLFGIDVSSDSDTETDMSVKENETLQTEKKETDGTQSFYIKKCRVISVKEKPLKERKETITE